MSLLITEQQNDDELYQLYLHGNTAAYDQLMIRYGDSLMLYLNGYLHDWHEAEDLMIEAFARIMAKKPSIREGAFKAYLFRTGRNLALRFFERKRRLRTFSMDGMDGDLAENILAADTGPHTVRSSAEEEFRGSERRRILLLCLERIEPELREALWLVYVEGLTYAQAATVTGVKEKRIDRLLSRGKQQMRKELAKEGVTSAYE